ncbi:hypothetical protein BGX29_003903 [Mortierella sp. GBA35]|nr:hypothetical protein BGX29_003903 [Mortierella sp. GBA35]
MIHQIYSILNDHTTVDRSLAQLIKEGTVRKFYIGGTGSDEFAIMLTADYLHQIDQAKEQYLKDLKEAQQENNSNNKPLVSSSGQGPVKRKLDVAAARVAAQSAGGGGGSSKRRVGSTSASVVAVPSGSATTVVTPGDDLSNEGEVFDRFKELVSAGHCLEISIQHSNIQDAIGASDQDITYSLLNRSLSAPANPHLINLSSVITRNSNNRNTSNTTGSGNNPTGGHSALNQLITATNQQHAKGLRADTPSSLPTSAAAGALVPTSSASSTTSGGGGGVGSGAVVSATTSAITDASARQGRVSDDVAYRFAIRQGGLFVTHFLKGRLEILRMVKRQMFGDMLTSHHYF